MTNPTLPLLGMTERAASADAEKTAIILRDRRLTYGALHDAVLRCVAMLRAQGVGAGDRIGYLGLNSPELVILLQATLRIGAVLVAINWRLTSRELGFILADAGIGLLVTETERLPVVDAARAAGGIRQVMMVDGDQPLAELIAAYSPDPALGAIAPTTVALQLYTSGTTGTPKGALLTHASLGAAQSQGRALAEDWARWDPDDVALVAMPQFHIGGIGWTLQALSAGATMVLLERPEISDIIAAISGQGATKMFAVPAVLNMILAHPATATTDFGSVRELLYGASPIPPDVLRRTMAVFRNAQMVQMYGATETSGTIVYLPPEDHHPDGTVRMTGCGKPYPSVELRIVGADGEILPQGSVGEVQVRSPLVMSGYHNLPEETAHAFQDGWFRSGDAGRLDADGYLYLLDRVKDMICSGGENIYPAEIEAVLHEHPCVRDCAVIGVPDARWGEAVKAVVVASGPVEAAELLAFARERLAGFKTPKSIDFVEVLPRNPSGKVLKRELRRPFWPAEERMIG